LSGSFALGIFGLSGVPQQRLLRFFAGTVAGAAIGATIWIFGVFAPGLGLRIFGECLAASLVIAASVETVTDADKSRRRDGAETLRRAS
jgi:hypothetical protein